MKSNCSFLTLAIFFLTTFAALGSTNKVGNGGDGVFCKKLDKTEGRLLDFYEKNFSIEPNETNPEIIAEKQIKKLENIAPKLSKHYLKRLKELPNEIEFKSEVSFIDIKDSNHFFSPLTKDCQILQVAIRKSKILPNEKRFLIREDLWKQMGPIHKAGLLTHEIIYEHLAKLGEEDSTKTRILNSFIFANEFKAEEFWRLIKELEVPIYP